MAAETIGNLQVRKWTFVAVSVNKNDIRIYHNGILDGVNVIETEKYKIKLNEDDIYIGGIPPLNSNNAKEQGENFIEITNTIGACTIEYSLDNFRIFDKQLEQWEIQANVGNSLGIIEPSYVHIACQSCTYADAVDKCPDFFHLCTTTEMYSGVYQAIKIMGWVSFFLCKK